MSIYTWYVAQQCAHRHRFLVLFQFDLKMQREVAKRSWMMRSKWKNKIIVYECIVSHFGISLAFVIEIVEWNKTENWKSLCVQSRGKARTNSAIQAVWEWLQKISTLIHTCCLYAHCARGRLRSRLRLKQNAYIQTQWNSTLRIRRAGHFNCSVRTMEIGRKLSYKIETQ